MGYKLGTQLLKQEIIDKYKDDFKQLGINYQTLTKKELLQIINFRCEHKHSFKTHPNCYRNSPDSMVEKIAILDIETSQLKANFGIILSWSVKELDGEIAVDVLRPDDVAQNLYDKQVTASLIKEMLKYNRLVTQFGTYFDIPFIRTRAERWGLDFPGFRSIYHTDVWKIAKRKLLLHSNRQGSIAETVLGHDIKTRVNPKIWLAIQFGNTDEKEKAMKYLIDHNMKDVIELEQIYKRLRKYIREGRTSI